MSIPYIPSRPIAVFKNDYVTAALLAVSLTAATYLLAFSLGWVSGQPNWLEVLASGMNYAATYLSIKQRRFFYMIGVAASAIYAVVYGQAGLLASAVLSLYLTLSLIYGFFRWGKDSDSRPVHHLSWKWLPVYLLVTVGFYAGASFTVHALGGTFAFWDAAILVLTILAQFMLDQKVIQTWIVWTLVNIVGVVLYFSSGLYFAAMQQLIFGLANAAGWYFWKRSMDLDRARRMHPSNRDIAPTDDPLSLRADGSIRPGDPAYDLMMGVLDSGTPVIANQRPDGTWKIEQLDK